MTWQPMATAADPASLRQLADEADLATNCLDDLRACKWSPSVDPDRWIADVKAPLRASAMALREAAASLEQLLGRNRELRSQQKSLVADGARWQHRAEVAERELDEALRQIEALAHCKDAEASA